MGGPEDRIGVERGWSGGRFRVLVCTGTGSDKITSSGTASRSDMSSISGLGFGIYMAVDLALVADVLPDSASVAKDLGVMNIAGAILRVRQVR